MKVNIGKYESWFGPYQLAEFLCFWARTQKDEHGFPSKPHWVHSFGEWLAHGYVEPSLKVGEIRSWNNDRPKTLLYRFLLWVHKFKKRKVKIRIDRWDVWCMQHTLALLILPMLLEIRQQKQGAPHVSDDDVPEHLRSTSARPKENDWDVDDNHFARWDWVLDEMVWTFEQILDDNAEDQFYSGQSDYQTKQLEDGTCQMLQGPNHTHVHDAKKHQQWSDRKQNGLRLFGKYYESLWT